MSTDPRLSGDVDETAVVVAEEVVGLGLEPARDAVGVTAGVVGMRARLGGLGVPLQVVADVEVEVAVVVQVGEGGRCRPVSAATQTDGFGDVLEGAVLTVPVEGIPAPAGHEEVRSAVVVEVAHGDTMPIAPCQGGDAGFFRDVLEGAVAAVPEQAVAAFGGCLSGGERAALDGVDVEPAVTVVVDQADAAAHGFGQALQGGCVAVVHEGETGRMGLIHKVRHVTPGRLGLGRLRPGSRGEQVGQEVGER